VLRIDLQNTAATAQLAVDAVDCMDLRQSITGHQLLHFPAEPYAGIAVHHHDPPIESPAVKGHGRCQGLAQMLWIRVQPGTQKVSVGPYPALFQQSADLLAQDAACDQQRGAFTGCHGTPLAYLLHLEGQDRNKRSPQRRRCFRSWPADRYRPAAKQGSGLFAALV